MHAISPAFRLSTPRTCTSHGHLHLSTYLWTVAASPQGQTQHETHDTKQQVLFPILYIVR